MLAALTGLANIRLVLSPTDFRVEKFAHLQPRLPKCIESLHAAIKNIGLDSCAERDDFIGVQLGVWLAAEKFLHSAPNERRARGATDEHDFVHVRGLKPRVGKRLLDRAHGAVNDRADERLERAARELVNENCSVRQAKPKCRSLRLRKLVFHGDQRFSKFLRQFTMG